MEIIQRHLWIILIVMTVLKSLTYRQLSKPYIAENPELKKGYDDFIKGWLFYANIPWVIMGIGALTGMANNIYEYLALKQMNPIVLIFHASIVCLWILSVWWIYFRNGAEFIEKHPGFINRPSFSGKRKDVTAKEIKIFYPVILLVNIIIIIMVWMMDIPLPKF